MNKYKRLLAKLATLSRIVGEAERRTAVYTGVHEDSSTASTPKAASEVEFCKKSNAATLLRYLDHQGMIHDSSLPNFIICQQKQKALSLYTKIFTGFSVVIATFCLIIFLLDARIINFDQTKQVRLIIMGSIAMIVALGLKELAKYYFAITYTFLIQMSLCLMAVGKSLLVFSVAQMTNSDWSATVTLLVITIITYDLYKMPVDRFLSSYALLLSILINIMWDNHLSNTKVLLLNMFFLLQMLSVAILPIYGKMQRKYVPLFYAIVFSIGTYILLLSWNVHFFYFDQAHKLELGFIKTTLTVTLIFLIIYISGGIEKLKYKPVLCAVMATIFLGFISAPGVLFTLGLLIFGYAKHAKPMIVTGILLMPIFLCLYYYNLDFSLSQKSASLFGSGMILLAARLYLKSQGWDRSAPLWK